MNIAVITGASSGMGRDFALEIDKKNLDEIWIIARRENRLTELKEMLNTNALILPLDLTKSDSFEEYQRMLDEKNPTVKYLVNASGFGKFGDFSEVSEQDSIDMINLNVKATVRMTVKTIPFMNRGSRIIQLCSSSSFLPLPYMNIYASTKAFISHYTKALQVELKPKGITATAVSPYFVETEFLALADKTKENGLKQYKPIYKSKDVVIKAIRDADKGKTQSVLGAFTNLFRFSSRFFSRTLMTKIWLGMRKEN